MLQTKTLVKLTKILIKDKGILKKTFKFSQNSFVFSPVLC